MLIILQVTGIEGTYRSTCESVMTVLRNNKDSLMAVLEAFVYDPLLNWRLMEAGVGARRATATTGATVVGTNPISVASAATTISEEASIPASFAASLSKKAAPVNFGPGGDSGKLIQILILYYIL